jgi:dimethylargininase
MPVSAPTRRLPIARRLLASLVVGIAVALTVHVANLLALFVANGSASANILPISNYFLPMSFVLFVLIALAAALGANRYWFTALAAGVLAGVLAVTAGLSYTVVSGGTVWSAEVSGYVLDGIIGTGLVFVVFAAIASLTVGRRLWTLSSRARSRGPIALVRQPASTLAEGEVTHLERTPIDLELADEQWQGYVDALAANGFEIVDVPAADELPDSVFVEDAVVVFGDIAVVTSPGAESRRPETDAVEAVVGTLGLAVARIELPGTLDGGDVLKVGDTVYVGRGGRTNAEGIRQLREIVTPLGYTVVAVPVKKTLHLKSAVTALPDGTVVGQAKVVDNPAVFPRFLALPEPGAAVVVLSDDAVLMASSVPKSVALIADLGYRVVTVDVSEFEKLEGCVTCLSVRVR